MAGDVEGALTHYRAAAKSTTNPPEQRYLTTKATQLDQRMSRLSRSESTATRSELDRR
jgi:hypothetical protein